MTQPPHSATPDDITFAARLLEQIATLREERGHWDTMRPRFTLDAELLASFEWHSSRATHCREAVWERVQDYPFLDRNEIGAEVRRCLEDCPPYQLRGHHAGR